MDDNRVDAGADWTADKEGMTHGAVGIRQDECASQSQHEWT